MLLERLALLIVLLFAVTGCFKKPAQEKSAVQTTVSAVPVYNGINGSYLVVQGPCKGDTAIVFDYSSASTPETIVTLQCTFDYVNGHLPVQAGTTNQVFSISVIGQYQNKKAPPTSVAVNFNPGPAPSAGDTINVAGGSASGPFAWTFDIAGEFFGGSQDQTSLNAVNRSGLSGILDP